MMPPSVDTTCSARCLFPLRDPRCADPCGRPAGHLRDIICACPRHQIDGGAPPTTYAKTDTFDKIVKAMQRKGFDPDQSRTIWKLGHRDTAQIESLSATHISRLIASEIHRPLDAVCVAGSALPPPRSDHPVLRPSLRGSRQEMFDKISTEDGRKEALATIEDLTETANSRRTNESLWHSWTEILEAWGQPPLPLTPNKVKMVAASLRAGRYRSAEPYFHRARMEQLRSMQKPADAATLDAMKRYARAIARGIGTSKLKDSIQLELLADHTHPPKTEAISLLAPTACTWPMGLFILGSWWLTRGIEATATRTACRLTVSWTLPASKTDVKALGATRTHCCTCQRGGNSAWGDKRDSLCPYHMMRDLIDLNESLFDEYRSGELPLFSSASGQTLSHPATVDAVRAVANVIGEPLHRGIDATRLERFGEHCMRVSGAQFLSRALLWDLFLVQLFGRWGSMAVASYIQEAPLAQASSRPPATSLPAVLRLVQEAVRAGREPQDEIGIASIRHDLELIMAKLKESQIGSIQGLQDRAAAEEIAISDEPTERCIVVSTESGITHEVLIACDEKLPLGACMTICGWKWAVAGANPTKKFVGVSSLPNFCKTCTKRAKGTTSEASSETAADEDTAPEHGPDNLSLDFVDDY